MSDQPDARGAAPGEGPGSPFYGPVHRYGRPRDDLRDGPPAARTQVWEPPGPGAAPGWGTSAPPHGGRAAAVGPPSPGTRAAPPGVGLSRWSQPRRHDHASWSRRVGAFLLDALPGFVAAVVLVSGYLPTYLGFWHGDLTVAPRYPLLLVGSLLSAGALLLLVGNRHVLAGRTGQSVGKRLMGIWLVHRSTGRPIGTLDAFVRDLLHVLDGLGGIGYLWPLWDEERQTLADKVAETVVVRTPVAPLTALERRPG